MAVLYTDNFNRADANLTTPWVLVGGSVFEVVSNTVAGQVAAGGGTCYYDAATPDDCYVKATYAGGSTSGGTVGLIARWTSSGEYYYLYIDPAAPVLSLYKYDFGNTLLDTLAEGPVTNDVFEIRVVGTSITVWRNGVEILSGTDATHATGKCGLYSNNGGNRQFLDDFEIGDFTGGGGGGGAPLMGQACL